MGSSDKRFKDLFLSGQTIDLGGATISSDGSGVVSISLMVLLYLKVQKLVQTQLQKQEQMVKHQLMLNFLVETGGTSTANATFKFQSKGLSYVFTDSGTFHVKNGTALEDSNPELFSF